jgi:hypothetical protein
MFTRHRRSVFDSTICCSSGKGGEERGFCIPCGTTDGTAFATICASTSQWHPGVCLSTSSQSALSPVMSVSECSETCDFRAISVKVVGVISRSFG